MKNVSGPVLYQNIFISNKVTPKVIHLFGDIHKYESECKQQDTTIVELLHNTLLSTSDVDLFVENANGGIMEKEVMKKHFDKGFRTKESNGYLSETIDFFTSEYNCLIHPIQDYCRESFPTHRFHNIDYRFFLYEQIKWTWENVLGFDTRLLVMNLNDESLGQEEHNDFIERHREHLSPEQLKELEEYRIQYHQSWYMDEIQPKIVQTVTDLIQTLSSVEECINNMQIQLLIWMDYIMLTILFNYHPGHILLLPRNRFLKDMLLCFTKYDTTKKQFVENTQQITHHMRTSIGRVAEHQSTFNYVKQRLIKSIQTCPMDIQDILRQKVYELWTTFVDKRNEYKSQSIYSTQMDLTPLFSYLMDYYVVIRLCKPYIHKCICYVGAAHVRNISTLLQSVFQDQFHGSIFYGDVSIIDDITAEVVQCIRIPLTDTIPPVLEFSYRIPEEVNQPQEWYDYFSYKERQPPTFRFEFKKDHPKKITDLMLWNGVKVESDVKQKLYHLFTKYGKQVDVNNPYEVNRTFRDLVILLHPDKTMSLPSVEQDEKEEKEHDLKTFIQLFQDLGYKGMKSKKKSNKSKRNKSRNKKI